MNKYQEAFYTITDWFHRYKDNKDVTVQETHITPEYRKAKKTIEELVDKATPIKPIKEKIIYNDFSHIQSYYCKCDRKLNLDDNYCPNCGQRLDWEVKDENAKKLYR